MLRPIGLICPIRLFLFHSKNDIYGLAHRAYISHKILITLNEEDYRVYPYLNNNNMIYRQSEKLIRDIEKAINGEYSAIQCYAKLANLAPTAEERKQILEIRQDEMKHFQQFGQIYVSLTGRQPQPKIIEECPNTYLAGLEFALKDEQETVDFYLDIAEETNNQYIKEVFRRAAADEQNHAVWFLYYFSKQSHRK
jgi:rubrerythrin